MACDAETLVADAACCLPPGGTIWDGVVLSQWDAYINRSTPGTPEYLTDETGAYITDENGDKIIVNI